MQPVSNLGIFRFITRNCLHLQRPKWLAWSWRWARLCGLVSTVFPGNFFTRFWFGVLTAAHSPKALLCQMHNSRDEALKTFENLLNFLNPQVHHHFPSLLSIWVMSIPLCPRLRQFAIPEKDELAAWTAAVLGIPLDAPSWFGIPWQWVKRACFFNGISLFMCCLGSKKHI